MLKLTKASDLIAASPVARWVKALTSTSSRFDEIEFAGGCDYSLIIVGAHNGRKTRDLVDRALEVGRVCLVEPTPYLFDELKTTYGRNEAVELLEVAVTAEDSGQVDIFAMRESANDVHGYGDQLGSLFPNHARRHDARFADHVHRITVKARTFSQIFDMIKARSVDVLFTDTEGLDAELLSTFPFTEITPHKIIFEYKHSDGTHRLGRNFISVMFHLYRQGYRTRLLDSENALATR